MTLRQLARRSLRHYWRTNLAVVAGVAIAVSVLAGALLVGESVKESLRLLAVGRLGRADHLIASTGFFRAALPHDLQRLDGFRQSFGSAVGLIAVDGLVSHGSNGRRASGVALYGVDESFWRFHGLSSPPALGARQALLSPALARELAAADGDGVLVRLQQPSAIPASTLHGRRDELGRTLRATVAATLPADRLGSFSLRPQQGEVNAIFLPLERLQRDLDRAGTINAVLVSDRGDARDPSSLASLIDSVRTLEDGGLRLRILGSDQTPASGPSVAPGFSLESDSGLIPDAIERTASRVASDLGMTGLPVFAYLAESLTISDGRQVAYSVVAGIDVERAARQFYPASMRGPVPPAGPSATRADGHTIWLNAWTAETLQPRSGDTLSMTFEVWEDGGGISKRTEQFTVAGVLPMAGVGADPTLTPEYPGISDQTSISDWDPPFPIDLSRITPRDEQYWDRHKAAPKAFIPYETARRLWGSRFGRMTSMRFRASETDASSGATPAAFAAKLRSAITLSDAGLVVQPVRRRALDASSGTTDFGQYFLYFSFFLVIAGLLLTGLFFRLGVEQRLREIGLLEAIGLTPRAVRGLFAREGFALALAGSLLGMAGAVGYAALIMLGLRTWWVGAVGTTALVLRPSALPLVAGAIAGVLTAMGVIVWSVRQASRAPARSLLKGAVDVAPASPSGRWRVPVSAIGSAASGLAAAVFVALAALGVLDQTAGFFGAGAAALVAALSLVSWSLRRPPRPPSAGGSWRTLGRFGISNARVRPGRTVLSIGLIAFATFVIVAVGAFRRGDVDDPSNPRSGTGGYALMAESVAPLMYDPTARAGAGAYGLDSPDIAKTLAGITVDRFRLRPGDDGSCLNLYRPERPRLVAPTPDFVKRGGRFTFAASLAETEAERRNPWLLLDRPLAPAGSEGADRRAAIPAIVDATSLQYVFHRALGDEIEIDGPQGRPLRLRFVASLSHSLFQSEILIPEAHFVELFPGIEGYRVWLVGAPAGREAAITEALESRLSDFGLEVGSTVERLRAYQQVENTYLSTFQALGALGLLLGTFGLGAVLVRNVLERRREVALLQAVGFERVHVRTVVISETLWIVGVGTLIGAAAALLSVQPALAKQGGGWPIAVVGGVAASVLLAGLLASLVATHVATRLPLLEGLKAE